MFKSIKNIVYKGWNYLSGKKTNIGAILTIGAKVFPDHTVAHTILKVGGEIALALGLGHKATKTEIAQKAMKENKIIGLRKKNEN